MKYNTEVINEIALKLAEMLKSAVPLCDYNGETATANNLESRAQEQ